MSLFKFKQYSKNNNTYLEYIQLYEGCILAKDSRTNWVSFGNTIQKLSKILIPTTGSIDLLASNLASILNFPSNDDIHFYTALQIYNKLDLEIVSNDLLYLMAGNYIESRYIGNKIDFTSELVNLLSEFSERRNTHEPESKPESQKITKEFIQQVQQNELSKDEIVQYLNECLTGDTL